jgi:RNA recognition motif-containing protein
MQRDLDLRSPIEAPRLDTVDGGGNLRSDVSGVPPGGPADRGRKKAPPAGRSNQRTGRATTEPQSIYVANLPWVTTEAELETLFGDHGRVHQTTIITDRRTGRSKGFGFVDMAASEARRAIEALHDTPLRGRNLTVRLAQPRRYGI